MSSTEEKIVCDTHGETPVCFVCEHIPNGVACGFHTDEDDPKDAWPNAFCDFCMNLFETAEEEPDLEPEVLCTHCYEAARRWNSTLPAELLGPELTEEAFSEICATRVKKKTAAAARLGFDVAPEAFKAFELDDKTQQLHVTRLDGTRFSAKANVAGEWNSKTRAWRWSWDDEDRYTREQVGDVTRVYTFGFVQGLGLASDPTWEGRGADAAYRTAAVAADLLKADALFVGTTPDGRVVHVLCFDLHNEQ